MHYSVQFLGPQEEDGTVRVLQTVPHEAESDEEAKRTATKAIARAKVNNCHGLLLLDAAGHELQLWHNEDVRDARRA